MSGCCEISTISVQEFQTGIMCSTNILSVYGQDGNILSICCSIDKFLLDFLEVIILANLFLSSFTDCHETRCMMSC